jgi:hypothetical protein
MLTPNIDDPKHNELCPTNHLIISLLGEEQQVTIALNMWGQEMLN